jgi:hypothetical protein
MYQGPALRFSFPTSVHHLPFKNHFPHIGHTGNVIPSLKFLASITEYPLQLDIEHHTGQ